MMSTPNTIEKKKFDRIKIIYDNDLAILDFIADLQSRDIRHGFQQFIDDSKGNPGCFLFRCNYDDMVVLILYKDPFGFCEGGNNLIMYADNEMMGLIRYFKKQLENTSPENKKIYSALDDITRLLYWQYACDEDKNTQCDFIG